MKEICHKKLAYAMYELAWPNLKFTGMAAVYKKNLFFFREASALLLRSFNGLNQAHYPDYQRYLVNCLWTLITSIKYFNRNI